MTATWYSVRITRTRRGRADDIISQRWTPEAAWLDFLETVKGNRRNTIELREHLEGSLAGRVCVYRGPPPRDHAR